MQTEAPWQGWFLGAGSVLCVLFVWDQCLWPTLGRNRLSLTSVPVVLSAYFLWRAVAILCHPEILGFSCEILWFLMFLWASQLESWNHFVRSRNRGCCDCPHNCSLLELANLFLNVLYPPADKRATKKQHGLHTERPGSGLLGAQLLFSKLIFYFIIPRLLRLLVCLREKVQLPWLRAPCWKDKCFACALVLMGEQT